MRRALSSVTRATMASLPGASRERVSCMARAAAWVPSQAISARRGGVRATAFRRRVRGRPSKSAASTRSRSPVAGRASPAAHQCRRPSYGRQRPRQSHRQSLSDRRRCSTPAVSASARMSARVLAKFCGSSPSPAPVTSTVKVGPQPVPTARWPIQRSGPRPGERCRPRPVEQK